VFGGRVTADTARVSMVLIALNVVVFLVDAATPTFQGRFENLAYISNGFEAIGVADGQYYRLITSAFLHASVLHIMFNMFALVQIGPVLENALGRARYLALYLLSAVGGSVAAFLLAPPTQPSVGASGAIFGLFGAYYVVLRRLGGETGSIVVLLGINLLITFTVPNIDWRGHGGGAGCGFRVRTPRASAGAAAHRGLRCDGTGVRGGSVLANGRPHRLRSRTASRSLRTSSGSRPSLARGSNTTVSPRSSSSNSVRRSRTTRIRSTEGHGA
jgi:membrane associated rhomboid family serine protease